MAQIAKSTPAGGQNLTTQQIATFAETGPSVAATVGWLATTCAAYVYLARGDGTPTLHAGTEQEGEVHIAPIPGEEFSLCAVGDIDPNTLTQVAMVLGVAMARQRAAVMEEAKANGDLLRALISGEAEAIERARGLGWDLDREVFVILARTNELQASDLAEKWRTIIRQRDPKGLVVFFPTEVVAVVQADSLIPIVFAQSLPNDDAHIGISRVGAAASRLGELYRQAELSISVSKRLGQEGNVASLDDLGAYRILAMIEDAEALRSFLLDTLGELGVRNDLEAIDLRRTLQTLLDHNLNIAEAARALHFHYNTLRYRIAKLQKMLGDFTSDPELRLAIALALRIHNLRGAD